jgi:three-Cys-motif partner protein
MNKFGGDWTKVKIEILVEYAQAYLTIMNKYPQFRTLYFDGFAGTGFIIQGDPEEPEVTIGAARRIVEIDDPKSFDGYYFVEKDSQKLELLKQNLDDFISHKQLYFEDKDCNDKLRAMAGHLNMPKSERAYDKVLAYVDPCGMQLEWSSLEALEGIDADVWILVPTGMGVNRLLKKDGEISEAWLERLELFLGISQTDILNHFYSEKTEWTLFGEQTHITKKKKAIERAATLYKQRLLDIFKYVTDPLVLENQMGAPMYHYLCASNNKTAYNIASSRIKKYSN